MRWNYMYSNSFESFWCTEYYYGRVNSSLSVTASPHAPTLKVVPPSIQIILTQLENSFYNKYKQDILRKKYPYNCFTMTMYQSLLKLSC